MAKASTPTRSAQAPASEYCFATMTVERVECDMCGTRAYSGIGASSKDGAAAVDGCFAARGWKIMIGVSGLVFQVCRNCARKLGPNWSPADGGK
jgi:hypothetical protein